MKRFLSALLVLVMLFSALPHSAFAATPSKSYATAGLSEIQRISGFVPGRTSVEQGNCYGFVSRVCELLFGVQYNGEGLYENYKAKHQTGNYYTVATFTTPNLTPTTNDVNGIIAFFINNAMPGDVVHYGAYDKNVSKTHTFIINSIDTEKMSVYHSNYQIAQYGKETCHIDNIYWESFRSSPTKHIKNSDGTLYSLNAMFYNTMKVGGVGITINRYTNYTQKFFPVTAAVPSVSVSSASSTGIRVEWNALDYANAYCVQYKKSNESNYTTASSDCTELSYTVENLTIGETYDFRVAAYIGSNLMKYSDPVSIQVLPQKISNVDFTPRSEGIQLSWQAASDISGVRIYKSESLNNNFTLIKTITDNTQNTFIDADIEYAKPYYYKIERYFVAGKKEYSSISDAVSGAYILATPYLSYKDESAYSITIGINKNGESDEFEYYIVDKDAQIAVSQTATKETELTFTNLNVGEKYTFYCRQKTKYGASDYSTLDFEMIPKKESVSRVVSKADGISVSFTNTGSIDGFCLYRSESQNGNYSLVATIENASAASYLDKSLKNNKTYYYKVRSYIIHNGEKIYSPYSEASWAVKSGVAVPADFKVLRRTPTSVTLVWSAVSNANRYIVEYKTEKGKWKSATVWNKNYTVISKLTTGTKYSFRIKAVNNFGAGSFSKAISKKILPPTPAAPKLAAVKSKGIKVSWDAKTWTNGYKIYRANSKDGKYTLVKTIKNPKTKSWIDKGVKKNKKYYYKTVCYTTKNKKTYNSPKSSASGLKYTK